MAGLGTRHTGYGLCLGHEKSSRYRGHKEHIAEAHLVALQQRHPHYYLELRDLMDDKIKVAEIKKDIMPIQEIADNAGTIIKHFYDLVGQHDTDMGAANDEALARLTEIRDLLGTCKLSVPDVTVIAKRLTDIETRLCCKLTEVSHGRVMPMSDKTRIGLVAKTLPQLTKGITDVFSILKEKWITEDNFDIWYARLLQALIKKFGEETWVDPNGPDAASFTIVEHIAACLDTLGDPRRGT